MNVRDSRVHNYPPRWNAAPSQDLLVIRRNHKTGEVSLDPLRWGLIPYWCDDPKGGRKFRRMAHFAQISRVSVLLQNRNAFGHALITDIAGNAGDKPLQPTFPR